MTCGLVRLPGDHGLHRCTVRAPATDVPAVPTRCSVVPQLIHCLPQCLVPCSRSGHTAHHVLGASTPSPHFVTPCNLLRCLMMPCMQHQDLEFGEGGGVSMQVDTSQLLAENFVTDSSSPVKCRLLSSTLGSLTPLGSLTMHQRAEQRDQGTNPMSSWASDLGHLLLLADRPWDAGFFEPPPSTRGDRYKSGLVRDWIDGGGPPGPAVDAAGPY